MTGWRKWILSGGVILGVVGCVALLCQQQAVIKKNQELIRRLEATQRMQAITSRLITPTPSPVLDFMETWQEEERTRAMKDVAASLRSLEQEVRDLKHDRDYYSPTSPLSIFRSRGHDF